jgi:hypothetical protein
MFQRVLSVGVWFQHEIDSPAYLDAPDYPAMTFVLTADFAQRTKTLDPLARKP